MNSWIFYSNISYFRKIPETTANHFLLFWTLPPQHICGDFTLFQKTWLLLRAARSCLCFLSFVFICFSVYSLNTVFQVPLSVLYIWHLTRPCFQIPYLLQLRGEIKSSILDKIILIPLHIKNFRRGRISLISGFIQEIWLNPDKHQNLNFR